MRKNEKKIPDHYKGRREKIAKWEFSHYATNQLLKQIFKKRKESADYKTLLTLATGKCEIRFNLFLSQGFIISFSHFPFGEEARARGLPLYPNEISTKSGTKER